VSLCHTLKNKFGATTARRVARPLHRHRHRSPHPRRRPVLPLHRQRAPRVLLSLLVRDASRLAANPGRAATPPTVEKGLPSTTSHATSPRQEATQAGANPRVTWSIQEFHTRARLHPRPRRPSRRHRRRRRRRTRSLRRRHRSALPPPLPPLLHRRLRLALRRPRRPTHAAINRFFLGPTARELTPTRKRTSAPTRSGAAGTPTGRPPRSTPATSSKATAFLRHRLRLRRTRTRRRATSPERESTAAPHSLASAQPRSARTTRRTTECSTQERAAATTRTRPATAWCSRASSPRPRPRRRPRLRHRLRLRRHRPRSATSTRSHAPIALVRPTLPTKTSAKTISVAATTATSTQVRRFMRASLTTSSCRRLLPRRRTRRRRAPSALRRRPPLLLLVPHPLRRQECHRQRPPLRR